MGHSPRETRCRGAELTLGSRRALRFKAGLGREEEEGEQQTKGGLVGRSECVDNVASEEFRVSSAPKNVYPVVLTVAVHGDTSSYTIPFTPPSAMNEDQCGRYR